MFIWFVGMWEKENCIDPHRIFSRASASQTCIFSSLRKWNFRQTQMIENTYVCERVERASFENPPIFLSLPYTTILCTMLFKVYNQNLWGPFLWGPLGSCPLCPILNPALVTYQIDTYLWASLVAGQHDLNVLAHLLDVAILPLPWATLLIRRYLCVS